MDGESAEAALEFLSKTSGIRIKVGYLATVLEVLRADVDEEVDVRVVHAVPKPVNEDRRVRVLGLERVPDSRGFHQF